MSEGGRDGRLLSEDVVAIDTWHDARWRQSQFAFIQIAALSHSLSEIKAAK